MKKQTVTPFGQRLQLAFCPYVPMVQFNHLIHTIEDAWKRKWQFQYSCRGNPMDRGAWWATVHGVSELGTTEHIRTHTHTHAHTHTHTRIGCRPQEVEE